MIKLFSGSTRCQNGHKYAIFFLVGTFDMDAHSNYDIQNSVLHDSYGTNKKPYIFAITNGQKHDSVIAHCKIGDKFYRYMRHKIMKKSVYMRCSHIGNKRTEHTQSSGFVRRCTSRVHLVPKAGHEHIIKKTEKKAFIKQCSLLLS